MPFLITMLIFLKKKHCLVILTLFANFGAKHSGNVAKETNHFLQTCPKFGFDTNFHAGFFNFLKKHQIFVYPTSSSIEIPTCMEGLYSEYCTVKGPIRALIWHRFVELNFFFIKIMCGWHLKEIAQASKLINFWLQ